MTQTTIEERTLQEVAGAARAEYALRERAGLAGEAYAELQPAELQALTERVVEHLPKGLATARVLERASAPPGSKRSAGRSPRRWRWLLVALVPGLLSLGFYLEVARSARPATIVAEPAREPLTEPRAVLASDLESKEERGFRPDPQRWLCTDSAFVDTSRVATGSDPALRDALWLNVRPGIAKGGATLLNRMDARPFQGRRVRLQARLATREVSGGAGLWLRADAGRLPDPGSVTLARVHARPLLGTHEAARYELVLDVPAEADMLALGAQISGTGQLWLDQVQLEIVPATYVEERLTKPGQDVETLAAPEPASGRRRPLRSVQ